MSAELDKKATVLVADDDVHIRRLLQVLLQNRGLHVVLASDGAEALEQARAAVPAVIVLDVNMPGMTGLEVCRAIRGDPVLRRTPVLILTAQGTTADKVAGFEVGADDYVQKPFDGVELVARIQALIARSSIYHADSAPAARPDGRVVAVIGAKGGVGTTTIASGLALVTAGLWSGGELLPAALVDLDLVHGHAAANLGLEPRRTLPDLATSQRGDLERDFLLEFVEQHSSGLSVLPGARTPIEGEHITADVVKRLLPVCRRCFSYTFVDLPSSFGESTLSTFDTADLILVVISPELSAIRSAIQMMVVFQALNIPAERWHFILNRPLDAGDLPPAALERTLHRPIFQALPNNGTRVLEANNAGAPLVLSQPGQPFSLAVEELAVRVTRAIPVPSNAGGAPTERVGRIERRLKR